MSQFYGRIQGNRGEATRLGSKKSGVDADARGWRIGGSVYMLHVDGKDHVRFCLNGGSGHQFQEFTIAEFEESDEVNLGWKFGWKLLYKANQL